jgi:hypothetical protein
MIISLVKHKKAFTLQIKQIAVNKSFLSRKVVRRRRSLLQISIILKLSSCLLDQKKWTFFFSREIQDRKALKEAPSEETIQKFRIANVR